MLRYGPARRYSIQISRDLGKTWVRFYQAKRCWTLWGARKEWWGWVTYEWGFATDLALFRIWDERDHRVAE